MKLNILQHAYCSSVAAVSVSLKSVRRFTSCNYLIQINLTKNQNKIDPTRSDRVLNYRIHDFRNLRCIRYGQTDITKKTESSLIPL